MIYVYLTSLKLRKKHFFNIRPFIFSTTWIATVRVISSVRCQRDSPVRRTYERLVTAKMIQVHRASFHRHTIFFVLLAATQPHNSLY